MSFKNEINHILNKYFNTTFSDYRYTVVAGKTLYLEGHTGIVSFDEKEITFRIVKKTIAILGTNLNVAEFDKDTAVITGEIKGVDVQWVGLDYVLQG